MWRGPSTKWMLWFVTHAELGVTEDLTTMGIYLPDLKSQGSMQSKSFTSSLSPLETAFPSHPFHSSCSKWTIQIPGWIRIFRPAFHKGGGLEISEPPRSLSERRKRSHDALKLDGAERNSDSLLWSSNRKTLPVHSGGE